jgi:sec-independent protein translocase protein TatA
MMNMLMIGLGWGEIVLIIAVLLLFFGAKKLPELAKGLGQGIKEFKKASSEVHQDFQRAVEEPAHHPAPAPEPPKSAASQPSTSTGSKPA